MTKGYKEMFLQLHAELAEYYYRWYFYRPVVVTHQRDDEMRRLAQLTGKAVHYYAEHYREYLDIIGFAPEVLELLEMCEPYPYRLGTIRPDYIISEDGRILLCEITARFFANGEFMSVFADAKGRELAAKYGVKGDDDYIEEMLACYAKLAEGYDRIVVLKSSDKTNAIKLYKPFYEALGKKVAVYEAEEIVPNKKELEGAFIVSALNQFDILKLPKDILSLMIESGHYNDFRTAFLAHDKRLFSLFFMDSFTSCFLNEEETAFLRAHVIPTYLYGRDEEYWKDAFENKDGYILKHYCLGKSEKVLAGEMAGKEEWKALFEAGEIKDRILQPFISQRTYENEWEGQHFREYVSGLLLCIDDEYFGTGMFRSSSLPVLNVGDDRKGGYVVTDNIEAFNGDCFIL